MPIQYKCLEKLPNDAIIIASKGFDIFFTTSEILDNNHLEDDGIASFEKDGKTGSIDAKGNILGN